MKKIFIILVLGLIIFGCADKLDIDPQGSTLTPEMVAEGAQLSPDRSAAGLVGMYSQLNAYQAVYEWQGDFGYPALAARLEHQGDNVVSTTHGYNWFSRDMRLLRRGKSESYPVLFWNHGYKYIKLANDIIASLDAKELPASVGQAYAFRAWSYFFLIQNFQQTYKGNESAPGLPIVTDQTPADQLSNNPRKTVQEVYDFILEDLGKALEYLPDGEASAKNFISKAVAYGIRSRVHLVMNKWNEAAADAQSAIDHTSATPFTIEDCSIPNFDDVATGKNTMWGIIIGPEDEVTKSGIANWTSMFTSLCFGNGGYTTMVNTYKRINLNLFEKIPTTDVRKGWWAHDTIQVIISKDEAGEYVYEKAKDDYQGQTYMGFTSPLLTNKDYKDDEAMIAANILSYSVLKFAPNNKDIEDPVNAVDFQLMRVEEMYYNLAEAKAMSGDLSGAKVILNNFVQTYRDPNFKSQATTPEKLQDEIYMQKRVEFWGEAISWFDMMRLKKGINRVDVSEGKDGLYPVTTRFNVSPEDPILIFQIPLSEEQSNKAVEGKNNPAATPPEDMM